MQADGTTVRVPTKVKRKPSRIKLTKRSVDSLKPGAQVFDEVVRGFGARALPSGRVSFFVKYVDRATGKQRLTSLGQHGNITVEQARELAEATRGQIATGRDPAEERRVERQNRGKARTVSELLDEFIELYVVKNALRSEKDYRRVFEHDVKPALGKIELSKLKRSDITKMLDNIEGRGASVMADRVLAHFRKALNWHAARDDEFTPPIVKGMARAKVKGRGGSRTRVLSDAEIKALWAVAGNAEPAAFGSLLQFLLLTAARRDEAARAVRKELAKDGTWTIPSDRYKTGIVHELPLSEDALAVLKGLPKLGSYFFTTAGKKPFSGFSKAKRDFDKKLKAKLKVKQLEPWRIHDLRRSARSLLSRGGVAPDIAERVLGHVIPGVRGVYDQHPYFEEKRAALQVLAGEIAKIVRADKT